MKELKEKIEAIIRESAENNWGLVDPPTAAVEIAELVRRELSIMEEALDEKEAKLAAKDAARAAMAEALGHLYACHCGCSKRGDVDPATGEPWPVGVTDDEWMDALNKAEKALSAAHITAKEESDARED